MTGPIAIVEPLLAHRHSGGCVYNSAVSRASPSGSIDLVTCEAPQAVFDLPYEFILLDTLWLRHPVNASLLEKGLSSGKQLWLLAHYFPPQDPMLAESEQAAWITCATQWLRFCTGILVVGRRVKAAWERFAPGLHVILAEPAVPIVGGHTPPLEGPLRIVSVGNVSPSKFPIEVVQHMARLETRHWQWQWQWQWQVLGEWNSSGSYESLLVAEIARHNLSQHVHFAGYCESTALISIMRQADIYVSPSLFESFGMATAEALSIGLPTLCFDVGDVRHWLGTNAYESIVEVGDLEGLFCRLQVVLERGRPLMFDAPLPDSFCRDWRQVAEKIRSAVALPG